MLDHKLKLYWFYPVMGVVDVARCAQFYPEVLGFQETFEADWYVSLVGADGRCQLPLLQYDIPACPRAFADPQKGYC